MNSKLAKKFAFYAVLAIVLLAALAYGKKEYDEYCFFEETITLRQNVYGYNPACVKTVVDGQPKWKVYCHYYRDWNPDPDLPKNPRYIRGLYTQYRRGY